METTSFTENYLRLHLLEVKASTPVLKELLLKIVRTLSTKGDVDRYLNFFKDEIKQNKYPSSAEYQILFPTTRKTDIDKWDIALFAYILIFCCSVEGQLSLKGKLNPREILKNEIKITEHGDLDSFLLANKNLIDQMKTTEEITDSQYEKLFPSNVQFTDVKAWDIELLLRILLNLCSTINIQKLCTACKSIITKKVALMCDSHIDLNVFLQKYKPTLDNLRYQEGKLTNLQYEQLFPQNGVSDLGHWENEVLLIVTLYCCGELSQLALESVKSIRQLRGELGAHAPDTEIDNKKFQGKWTQLTNAINNIIVSEKLPIANDVNMAIHNIENGPLDIQSSVSVLRENYTNYDTKNSLILEKLANIESTLAAVTPATQSYIGSFTKTIMAGFAKIGRQLASVSPWNRNIRQIDKSITHQFDKKDKDIQDLRTFLNNIGDRCSEKEYSAYREIACFRVVFVVSGSNKAAVEKIEENILKAMKEIDDQDTGKIKEVTHQIMKMLLKDGTTAVKIRRGSVDVTLKVISIKGLYNLVTCIDSDEFKKRLNQLATTITEMHGIEIKILVNIPNSTTIIDEVEEFCSQCEFKEYQGAITLELKASSVKGLTNVWQTCQDSEFSSKLQTLSNILSGQVMEAVDVTIVLNSEEFRSALESAESSGAHVSPHERKQSFTGQSMPDDALDNLKERLIDRYNSYLRSCDFNKLFHPYSCELDVHYVEMPDTNRSPYEMKKHPYTDFLYKGVTISITDTPVFDTTVSLYTIVNDWVISQENKMSPLLTTQQRALKEFDVLLVTEGTHSDGLERCSGNTLHVITDNWTWTDNELISDQSFGKGTRTTIILNNEQEADDITATYHLALQVATIKPHVFNQGDPETHNAGTQFLQLHQSKQSNVLSIENVGDSDEAMIMRSSMEKLPALKMKHFKSSGSKFQFPVMDNLMSLSLEYLEGADVIMTILSNTKNLTTLTMKDVWIWESNFQFPVMENLVSLSLENMNGDVAFMARLSNMKNLTTLAVKNIVLWRCKLQFPVLSNVVSLTVENAKRDGVDIPTLINMKKLTTLTMKDVLLSNEPFPLMDSLVSLSLEKVCIHCKTMNSLSNMKNLTALTLKNMTFWELKISFPDMAKVVSLTIENFNGSYVNMTSLSKMKNLTIFTLKNINMFERKLHFPIMTKLVSLTLENLNGNDLNMTTLSNIKNLKTLIMKDLVWLGCELQFPAMDNVMSLTLENVNGGDIIMSILSNVRNLTTLSIKDMWECGSLGSKLQFPVMENVISLTLENVNIDAMPYLILIISNLKKLTTLTITDVDFGDSNFEFPVMDNMQTLSLTGVYGELETMAELIASLSKMKNLTSLTSRNVAFFNENKLPELANLKTLSVTAGPD